MKKIFGDISGLKTAQITRLENLYDQRVPPEYLISDAAADVMCRISAEIRRQVGVLVNRRGKVASVMVGDYHGLVLPDTSEYRIFPGRLKGIRCIHTHLKSEPLSNDDLADLSLLRLDMMAALTITSMGAPHEVFAACILPFGKTPYQFLPTFSANLLAIGCLERILAVESELSRFGGAFDADSSKEKALLVSVSHRSRQQTADSMKELEELAASCGIDVAGVIFQHRRQADSRFLTGAGKLRDITLTAIEKGARLIIFDQDLNPSQIRSITDQTDMKVIDRTQLILDIFAQRAQSREGKLQVELAQLEYMLPRLVVKNTAMSRLTGGIGGRGPGETKLEINRRRVRERIQRLEKSLEQVALQRRQQKARRRRHELPVISIIGYTNAGKSTLLNTLTHSQVLAEQRLFATLDPSSRRLRFPKDVDVIITDTVGFIRDLPQDLQVAFRSTLEELESADLLLHVIDVSNPRCEEQIQSVETILENLGLNHIPVLRVLNKMDALSSEELKAAVNRYGGISICARDHTSLTSLVETMSSIISRRNKPDAAVIG